MKFDYFISKLGWFGNFSVFANYFYVFIALYSSPLLVFTNREIGLAIAIALLFFSTPVILTLDMILLVTYQKRKDGFLIIEAED